jgi:hypothetical protein
LENETDLMIFAEEQAIDPRQPQLAHDILAGLGNFEVRPRRA